jgi:phosphopantothenoylcysteine decarboxylase/phosphopantothenate--cysteine ligase
MSKKNKHILLIITGSIAAYKSLDLIRLLHKNNITTSCVMTKAAQQFITPLAVASISGQPVYTDLFSLKDETEMGHIRLTREADLVVIAPASADIIAKLAHGLADDLASTLLLASNKKIVIAPAMNSCMWENAAVQRNVKILQKDGIIFVGPDAGELACKEEGYGRMSDPSVIANSILKQLH